MQFENKRVLITGGGSGIGLAITRAMVQAGANVVITGRNPRKLEEVAKDQPAITGKVSDVTDDAAVQALRDELLAEGGIDVLVNNAGVLDMFHVLDGHPLDAQIKEIGIDAIGPLRMIHHFLPSMLKRESMIVNVSSSLAYVPYVDAPVYSAAKAFEHAYTRCLREQLKATSVRVVELLPPVVETPMASGFESPIPPMPADKLAAILMRGLRRGKNEITPGIATPLKWVGRLLPGVAFKLLNKDSNTQKRSRLK